MLFLTLNWLTRRFSLNWSLHQGAKTHSQDQIRSRSNGMVKAHQNWVTSHEAYCIEIRSVLILIQSLGVSPSIMISACWPEEELCWVLRRPGPLWDSKVGSTASLTWTSDTASLQLFGNASFGDLRVIHAWYHPASGAGVPCCLPCPRKTCVCVRACSFPKRLISLSCDLHMECIKVCAYLHQSKTTEAGAWSPRVDAGFA